MAWTWRMEDGSGGPAGAEAVSSPEFPAQADAETWIGEVWPELRAAGVAAVTLLEGDRVAYGPMSLDPLE